MTEEDKRKKEEEHLRTVAYTALMDGTSIDSLINFRMKTPERWMQKWEQNLQILPKAMTTVVEKKANSQVTDKIARKILKDIKR